uniref:Metalloendopeptidase n=1 Tax=Physocyclus mexicanus TaxID=1705800 RepID=A0A6B9KEA8_9ARAC|nr:astacin metalloprotease M12 peptidase [Physocyclus mexicanus]
MMKGIVFALLLSGAFAVPMSPEDIDLEKQLWENENVIEGDILVLPTSERLAALKRAPKWPNGLVPYDIDSTAEYYRGTIEQTIKHIEDNTCIRFKKAQGERSRVTFTETIYCQSYIGRTGVNQKIEIAPHCDNIAAMAHEILHALGFVHEHRRSDRDSYVTINYQNIPSRNTKSFKKYYPNENRLLNTFDYESVMLYGEYNGSNGNGKAMEAKNHRILRLEEKPGLSRGDIDKINEYYNC